MNKFIIFTTLFITGLLTAQVSENRTVGNFSKLKASAGIEVFYIISDKISITVETDDAEKMQFIKTEVVGETLEVFVERTNTNLEKSKKKKNKRYRNWINGIEFNILKVTVSGPNLTDIKASSSAKIQLQNVNTSANLDIKVSSSGKITGTFETKNAVIEASSSGGFGANISAEMIDMKASSSAGVELRGKAKKLFVKASSSSDCRLKNLEVEQVTIEASSSAAVAITVTNSLEAKASSSASVSFYGNPANVSKEVSSSGSVSKR